MSVNVEDYIHPNCDSVHFTEAEWKRAKKNIDKIKQRLNSRVKHIIKANGPIRRKWVSKEQIKKQLDDIDIKIKQLQNM